MNLKRKLLCFIVFFLHIYSVRSQDISLYEQLNGTFDFTLMGNTLNLAENNFTNGPVTTTTSSASLNLSNDASVVRAYLYWAGSGDGDFNIKLNANNITPDRTFSYQRNFDGLVFTYFSAFKDITQLVQTTGNGNYTLSELDVSPYISLHLQRKTNFAGWAIVIVYSRPSLPLNQINIYDGLEGVPSELNITLNDLNVVDNLNSKVGFLAWEGDSGLATEEFRINGDLLFNALNPSSNVFNSTNSVTGSTTLYNMDLDIYDIQNNIQIGDTEAEITLSSSVDFVMINTVVTKLNSQVPDGRIAVTEVQRQCDSRSIIVNYTVSNADCTGPLPTETPVSVYVDNLILEVFETNVPVPINGAVNGQITLMIPDTVPNDFELKFVIDDKGDGSGIVNEISETNNTFNTSVNLITAPMFNPLPSLESCNEGFSQGTFDFSNYDDLVKTVTEDIATFFESREDAESQTNPILNTNTYVALATPKEIFVRLDNPNCYSVTSFILTTRNCPPTVYNFVSANQDGSNDTFTIKGLENVFLNYKIEIYNRWGKLIWTGNQNTDRWDGTSKEGFATKNVPDGTYFYVIYLNDVDYPEPLTGYLYLEH
ncbi:gliding motility-associated C-terminal domain-containing protein [Flavobacterium sp.]|uniref:gliding motility-associated C-terminal domain-containing protein n=1 Tax=Flavobacterium sp. TaxID=239 RepID=UPI0037BFE8C5